MSVQRSTWWVTGLALVLIGLMSAGRVQADVEVKYDEFKDVTKVNTNWHDVGNNGSAMILALFNGDRSKGEPRSLSLGFHQSVDDWSWMYSRPSTSADFILVDESGTKSRLRLHGTINTRTNSSAPHCSESLWCTVTASDLAKIGAAQSARVKIVSSTFTLPKALLRDAAALALRFDPVRTAKLEKELAKARKELRESENALELVSKLKAEVKALPKPVLKALGAISTWEASARNVRSDWESKPPATLKRYLTVKSAYALQMNIGLTMENKTFLRAPKTVRERFIDDLWTKHSEKTDAKPKRAPRDKNAEARAYVAKTRYQLALARSWVAEEEKASRAKAAK